MSEPRHPVYYSITDMRDSLVRRNAFLCLFPSEIYSALADFARAYSGDLDTVTPFELPSDATRADIAEEILDSAERHGITLSAVPVGYSFEDMISDIWEHDSDNDWL